MPSIYDLQETARVWITLHRQQFLVLVAIAVCLALIAFITIVLIKTRPKRPRHIPELTGPKDRQRAE